MADVPTCNDCKRPLGATYLEVDYDEVDGLTIVGGGLLKVCNWACLSRFAGVRQFLLDIPR